MCRSLSIAQGFVWYNFLSMLTTFSLPRHHSLSWTASPLSFSMTNMGNLHYFLGKAVSHTPSGLFLSQSKYVVEILDKADMTNCKPSTTPVDTSSKVSDQTRQPFDNPTLYWSLAGALQYLTITRPNIQYAV
ncbi:hypothetical protein V2J09_018413 [Rumex salicifolius]